MPVVGGQEGFAGQVGFGLGLGLGGDSFVFPLPVAGSPHILHGSIATSISLAPFPPTLILGKSGITPKCSFWGMCGKFLTSLLLPPPHPVAEGCPVLLALASLTWSPSGTLVTPPVLLGGKLRAAEPLFSVCCQVSCFSRLSAALLEEPLG